MRGEYKLAVNELFGVTIQGEGVNLGRQAVFLRMAGCNLHCSWCDTPYSWDFRKYDRASEVFWLSHDQVYDRVIAYEDKMAAPFLVITGGEPMLQQDALLRLTKRLHKRGWYTSIETAGTIKPDTLELVKHWTISPKLENSGNDYHKRFNVEALDRLNLAPSREFKYVVTRRDDLDEIKRQVELLDLSPVYIMAEGTTAEDIISGTHDLADLAIEYGFNLTTRLQIIAWGNKRGV
jgi:7-carboxy-7-deazaguanine synthase